MVWASELDVDDIYNEVGLPWEIRRGPSVVMPQRCTLEDKLSKQTSGFRSDEGTGYITAKLGKAFSDLRSLSVTCARFTCIIPPKYVSSFRWSVFLERLVFVVVVMSFNVLRCRGICTFLHYIYSLALI